MLLNRISPDLLIPRLDAEYYQEHFVANDRAMRQSGLPLTTIGAEVTPDAPVTYGIVQPGGFVSNEHGIPMIRCVDISDGVLDPATVLCVTPEIEAPYQRARVSPGDCLLSIVGTVGRSALVPASLPRANLNQSVARVRFRAEFDAHWGHAFLSSSHGQALLLREQRGFIQKRLNIEDIPSVTLGRPSAPAQRYIGDKVRQAERLRDRARYQRETLAELLHIEGLREAMASPDSRTNRASLADLRPRLDAKYYGARALAVLRTVATDSIPLTTLVDDVSNGFEHRTFVHHGTRYITVTDVSGGRLVLNGAPMISRSVKIPDKARVDSRCALVVRTGVGIGTTVKVFEEDSGASISSHLIRLQCSTDHLAAVVAAFLNSNVGLALQQRISYGVAQPQIGQDELLAIPVPRALVQRGEPILHALKTEDECLRGAERLTVAATALVELLVEGRASESDLVAAQRGLEAKDRSADRALLQTLCRGTGSLGSSLFPDVDGLYALLDDVDNTAEGGD